MAGLCEFCCCWVCGGWEEREALGVVVLSGGLG